MPQHAPIRAKPDYFIPIQSGDITLICLAVSQLNAFNPFYRFVEPQRYRMYFDPKHRRALW
jgi:hypothetical protein